MCLISETNIPHVAENDITVFKIVCYDKKNPNKFFPFMYGGVVYELGKKAYPVSYKEFSPFTNTSETNFSAYIDFKIGEGAIHSSKNLRNLLSTYRYTLKDSLECYCILRCVIPKETKYFCDDKGDMASEKIIPQTKVIDFGKDFSTYAYYDEGLLRLHVSNETEELTYLISSDNKIETVKESHYDFFNKLN